MEQNLLFEGLFIHLLVRKLKNTAFHWEGFSTLRLTKGYTDFHLHRPMGEKQILATRKN